MIYFLLVILLILTIISRSPTIKGMIGEYFVNRQLRKLDPQKYITINNITIPSVRGKTTQIDHIIVSIYGIFVIETKNYTGWIVGDEKAEYWQQVIYKRKEKIYNPIRQNYGHVMALKSLIGEEDLPFIPIICFSTRADLKVKVTSTDVIYSPRLLKTLQKYNEQKLTVTDVKRIHNLITNGKLTDESVKKTHIQSIKHVERERKEKLNNNECPKCGGALVIRNGKHGSFKGCSSFPKCRFIHKE